MSFTSQIKEELTKVVSPARGVRLAELAAMTVVCGQVTVEPQAGKEFTLATENEFVARKCFTLAQKSLKVYVGASVRVHKNKTGGKRNFRVFVEGENAVASVLEALKEDKKLPVRVHSLLCKDSEQRRAVLRGYFLACGMMSDPKKGYHLELAVTDPETAKQILSLMESFSLEGRTVGRKNHIVVYLKEGEGIADFLKVIGANGALLDFESARVIKDMRGRVNRKVNCEAANIQKTVNAATRQREDILLVEKRRGLSSLPKELSQIASLRLEYPEASLEELGKMCEPPVGKSGVNHRLRRIGQIAKELS